MRSSDLSKEVLSQLEINSLQRWLQSRGWRRRGKEYRNTITLSKVFEHRSKHLRLPLDRSLDDFGLLLRDALETASMVEEIPVGLLAQEVQQADVYLFSLTIRGEDDQYQTMRLDDAGPILLGLRDVVRSAADAVEAASPVDEPWRGIMSRRYLRLVRLGQTEPGSYVFNAFLPLRDEVEPEHTPSLRVFGEQVGRELARGLHAVGVLPPFVASEVASEQLVGVLGATYASGIAAALGRMRSDEVQGVSVKLSRSLRQPDAIELDETFWYEKLRTLGGVAAELPLELPAAAQVWPEHRLEVPAGELPYSPNIELWGDVTDLSRPDIHIRASIEGRDRRVRVSALTEEEYRIAADAHLEGGRIRIIGDLLHRPRVPLLENVRLVELADSGNA